LGAQSCATLARGQIQFHTYTRFISTNPYKAGISQSIYLLWLRVQVTQILW